MGVRTSEGTHGPGAAAWTSEQWPRRKVDRARDAGEADVTAVDAGACAADGVIRRVRGPKGSPGVPGGGVGCGAGRGQFCARGV